MAGRDVGGDVVEVDAADRAGQAGEVLVEHGLRDADGLEQLARRCGEATVEMPIFDITFSTPLPAALM